ncbi:MAG: hypothetical protein KTR31_28165 [Myxococcales bacterium]|nr:hypothetical protein [Myxococcales bacterium]
MMTLLVTLFAQAQSAPTSDLIQEGAVLEGRYRMVLHSATRTKVPVFGWTRAATITTLVADITPTDTGLVQRHEVCDVQIRSRTKETRTTIPRAFIEAMPIKRYAVHLAPRVDAPATYRADLGTSHLGYDPAQTDSVPTEANDPALLDHEGDGHPAATVRVDVPMFGNAEMYVVQRAQMLLDGALEPEGGVAGQLRTVGFEQHTVDASNRMFRMSPRIETVHADSWFRLIPHPGASCDTWTVDTALQDPRARERPTGS